MTPKTLSEVILAIIKIIDSATLKHLPIKEVLDFGKE